MVAYRQQFGHDGESLALQRYEADGYDLIERNWRCELGEIDLIVAASNEVVFVEVKTRSSDRFGTAAEAVTWRKQQKIRQLALRWLQESDRHYDSIRFDVATVDSVGNVELLHGCF